MSNDIHNAPPHDIQAEMAVLGSMILSADAAEYAVRTLHANAFYKLAHQELFEAMRVLWDARGTVDCVLLRFELLMRGEWHKIGGAAYLAELMDSPPASVNIEHYVAIVREMAGKRALLEIVRELRETVPSAAVDALVSQVSASLESVPRELAVWTDLKGTLSAVEARIEAESRGDVRRVSTGILPLDRILRGMEPGLLYVVCARPRDGKTALLCQIALHVACDQKRKVVIFSAEVPREQLLSNMMRIRAQVNWQDMRQGSFAGPTYARWQQARKDIETAPLLIGDQTDSIGDIVARALPACRDERMGFVCADFIQLLRAPGKQDIFDRVSRVTLELKRLAKRANVPVLALSQLTRPSKDRGDSLPKGSGVIEEAADVLLMLKRRPEFEWGKDSKEPDIAVRRFMVAKNRHGPEGQFYLLFDKPILTFGSEVTKDGEPLNPGGGSGDGERDREEGTRGVGVPAAPEGAPTGRDDPAPAEKQTSLSGDGRDVPDSEIPF